MRRLGRFRDLDARFRRNDLRTGLAGLHLRAWRHWDKELTRTAEGPGLVGLVVFLVVIGEFVGIIDIDLGEICVLIRNLVRRAAKLTLER